MKKLQCLTLLLISSIVLTLVTLSCNDKKTGNEINEKDRQDKKMYNLIVDKDTVPINLRGNLKGGLYMLDSSNNLRYVESKNDDPVPASEIAPEHNLFKTQNPSMTYAVNFMPEDIGGYYNTVMAAAKFDKKTVDSFRLKFIVYDHAPIIRGNARPDYIGKVSVALFAMSGGTEYTSTTMPGVNIDPRNLGTICPVCQIP